jgi:hypothetical protein
MRKRRGKEDVLVNTSEGAGDDSGSTEETGLESGVLTGRSLTVVLVTDNDPSDALVAVLGSDLGNTTPRTSELVLDLVRLAVRLVDGTDQAVLRIVLEGQRRRKRKDRGVRRTCEMFSR